MHSGLFFNQLIKKWGAPCLPDGGPCRFCVIALGKLGGNELNYSSDIDLIFAFEADGKTRQGIDNAKFFEMLCRDTVKLLNETTPLGAAYRVDLRLRPEGSRGRICNSVASMLRYYDLQGRTWERQALIKARSIAGDLELGRELLAKLQPWIYQRNLSRSDISGIKALKRKIERQALQAGEEFTNVKTGHGGIRDIEFAIQFLQLLNGGGALDVKASNTLDAIQKLARAQCLNMPESQLLSQNYCWLRKLEHRLQIMFDIQTHTLPDSDHELEKVARRMGYAPYFGRTALDQFQSDFDEVTQVNRKILDHLLHQGFGSDDQAQGDEQVPLAVDLILDPSPSDEMLNTVLGNARFQDHESAFQNLIGLSNESTVFLSSKRCRHFMASIMPELMTELSQTPDPDATLRSLSSVAESIGAKGVLWELFRYHPPSLHLFVRLCACSDYLTRILRQNPGMVDELTDSLMMEQLPTFEWLSNSLTKLTRNATDADPIIHSFKNAQHLRVGIRDILGRDEIWQTHRALSDIAQVCFANVADREYWRIGRRYSHSVASDQQLLDENALVILGLGKLGGREPNYHSDLDVVFLYDEGANSSTNRTTSSQHFYSELAACITKEISRVGPHGKLYEIDTRLRPTGKSGVLTVSFSEFDKYFESGQGQVWERQALCKARPIYGSPELVTRAMKRVEKAISVEPWRPEMANQIRDMRIRWQQGASSRNLKRGIGGTVDVEFIVQMLQLKHIEENSKLRAPGTFNAIEKLKQAGFLSEEYCSLLSSNYQTLRAVEARLRLMDTAARHDFPNRDAEIAKLAFLLKSASIETLKKSVDDARASNRKLFELIFDHAVNDESDTVQ